MDDRGTKLVRQCLPSWFSSALTKSEAENCSRLSFYLNNIYKNIVARSRILKHWAELWRTCCGAKTKLRFDFAPSSVHRFQLISLYQADCQNRLIGLDQNLVVIEDLIRQFNAYQFSYSELLVEIARRRQYKEAAENIVSGMVARLEAMSEGVFFSHYLARGVVENNIPEERKFRESFNAEHGAHLPSDLCLYIENPPTRWQVIPHDGDDVESLPDVDNDLLEEVDSNLARVFGRHNLQCLLIGQRCYRTGRRVGAAGTGE